MNEMMKCGHAANATHEGKPVCAIHFGLTPDAEVVVPVVELAGRLAVCAYCHRKTPSRMTLAFFESRPNLAEDGYYCGCRGWD